VVIVAEMGRDGKRDYDTFTAPRVIAAGGERKKGQSAVSTLKRSSTGASYLAGRILRDWPDILGRNR
jgi:hypothetical protein